MTLRASSVTAVAVLLCACEGEIASKGALEIGAPATSCPKGRWLRLNASAVYSSDSRVGVTVDTTWSSSNPDVGTFANVDGRHGIFSCLTEGTAHVTASYGGYESGVDVTVTEAVLDSVELSAGAAAMLPLGTSRALAATGHFSDGATRDVTPALTWSSSATAVVSIDGPGAVTARGMGSARIEARAGAVAAAVEIPTGEPLIQRIEAAIDPAVLPKGVTARVTVTGWFSDGRSRDVTTGVEWASSNLEIARVTGGAATAVAPGTAQLTARIGGLTASVDVTVIAAALVSLRITPDDPDLAAGQVAQLGLEGTYTDGTMRDLRAMATWASSAPAVVLPDPAGVRGLFWAVGPGDATLTSNVGDLTAHLDVTVDPARLVEVVLSPAAASLPRLSTQQYTATGVYTDQSRVDFTAQVAWASSDPAIVSIDASGLATANALGPCTIRAAFQGKNPFTSVTVVPAALTRIEVSPSSANVAKGRTQAFVATGFYADGTQQDLTAQVTWSSTNVNVALVSNAAPTSGVARTFGTGNTTIGASFGGKSASAALAVGPAELDRVEISAPTTQLATGVRVTLRATAVYSDSTTADVTELAGWSTSDAAIVSVSTLPGTRGEAQGQTIGEATVTAQFADFAPRITLTVTAARLLTIAVSPPSASLPRGATRQYQAVGVYTDSTSRDLTSQVAWDGTAGVVSVSSSGLATAIDPGPGQVSATLDGVTGRATVQVTPAQLVSVTVTPPAPALPAGTGVQLTATGAYTDGSSADLSSMVAWSTAAPNLTVSASGWVRAVTQGPAAVVTATIGAFTATATVTANAARLDTLNISPLSATIAQATTRQFSATGVFSDGSVLDLTPSVAWGSSNGSVAAISNSPGSSGLASALSPGTTVISAVKDGLTSTTTLTVQAGTIVSIDVFGSSASAPKGTLRQLFAQATLSDGSTQDVTAQATWASTALGVATVSNGSTSRGLVTAVDVGTTDVSATVSGVTGVLSFTVTPAALTSIVLTPQSPTVVAGFGVALTAFGNYTDGSTADITAQVLWTTSNAAVADVSNVQGSQGWVTGVAAGQATVRAALSGRTATTPVTVTP